MIFIQSEADSCQYYCIPDNPNYRHFWKSYNFREFLGQSSKNSLTCTALAVTNEESEDQKNTSWENCSLEFVLFFLSLIVLYLHFQLLMLTNICNNLVELRKSLHCGSMIAIALAPKWEEIDKRQLDWNETWNLLLIDSSRDWRKKRRPNLREEQSVCLSNCTQLWARSDYSNIYESFLLSF